MKQLLFLCLLLLFYKAEAQNAGSRQRPAYVLVIHGGAGTILKSQMTAEREQAYLAGLNAALDKGNEILARGGSALEAVEKAVQVLEDNPLFNAGKGAVFTHEGRNELDAAIMDGHTLAAGAVAGVTVIRNPISAARAVMEKSAHVMMAGKGAEQFAAEQGLEIVEPSYFFTQDRWRGLQRALQLDSAKKEERDTLLRTSAYHDLFATPGGVAGKYGTVGAVALDRQGNLAAATSTGGMTNKKYGRIGDAPVIGAGTYADNKTAAISCTGWGEFYIRLVMAKTVCDMMEFGKLSLKQAADQMIMKKLPALGGDGGMIAVDRNGNIAMPFCSEGMYRGFIRQDGQKTSRQVSIYKE